MNLRASIPLLAVGLACLLMPARAAHAQELTGSPFLAKLSLGLGAEHGGFGGSVEGGHEHAVLLAGFGSNIFAGTSWAIGAKGYLLPSGKKYRPHLGVVYGNPAVYNITVIGGDDFKGTVRAIGVFGGVEIDIGDPGAFVLSVAGGVLSPSALPAEVKQAYQDNGLTPPDWGPSFKIAFSFGYRFGGRTLALAAPAPMVAMAPAQYGVYPPPPPPPGSAPAPAPPPAPPATAPPSPPQSATGPTNMTPAALTAQPLPPAGAPPGAAAPAPRAMPPDNDPAAQVAPQVVSPPLPVATATTMPPVAPQPRRRGFLALPFIGVHSYQGDTGESFDPGLRLGTLLGGSVSEMFSLNGELSLDLENIETPAGGTSVSSMTASVAFSPLLHLATGTNTEMILGPKLGFFANRWSNSGVRGSQTGWVVGLRGGFFGRVSPGTWLGGLATFEIEDPTRNCFQPTGEVEQCDETTDFPVYKLLTLNAAALF